MERAAILGVYDYLGYGLCKYMLDEGVEIEGVDLSLKEKDHFKEEKRMEIGRNANFLEVPLTEWVSSAGRETVFISFYELLKDPSDRLVNRSILKELESFDRKHTVIILPAYLSLKNADNSVIKHVRRWSVTEIYLPTVYGPWQPEEFFFQRALNFKDKQGECPEPAKWEWREDAIFIDDAVRSIAELAENGGSGRYFLTSGIKDSWEKCAQELLGNSGSRVTWKSAGKPELEESIKVRKIKGNEKISEGLLKQQVQYKRIQESRV